MPNWCAGTGARSIEGASIPADAAEASPGRCSPTRVTSTPRSASAAAAVSPIRPLPTTITSLLSLPPLLKPAGARYRSADSHLYCIGEHHVTRHFHDRPIRHAGPLCCGHGVQAIWRAGWTHVLVGCPCDQGVHRGRAAVLRDSGTFAGDGRAAQGEVLRNQTDAVLRTTTAKYTACRCQLASWQPERCRRRDRFRWRERNNIVSSNA